MIFLQLFLQYLISPYSSSYSIKFYCPQCPNNLPHLMNLFFYQNLQYLFYEEFHLFYAKLALPITIHLSSSPFDQDNIIKYLIFMNPHLLIF